MSKLVRDKIPQIIKEGNLDPVTHIATSVEFQQKLKEKLQEEVNEFLESGSEEELADIIEVMLEFLRLKNLDFKAINEIRIAKKLKRGGFSQKIILDEIKRKE